MTVVDIDQHDPDARHAAELLAEVRATLHDLGVSLVSSAAAQWQAPPRHRPSEDTTERAKGGHSDPTPSVALDARRLAVREQFQRTESLLRNVNRALSAARHHLDQAITAWEGNEQP